MKNLFIMLSLLLQVPAIAQVKIGDNPGTINANSLLEMESSNKGFLPPRVALNSLTAVTPLTGTVPAGMLVYSTGGTLPDGYYYWNNSQWVRFAGEKSEIVYKSANATLAKADQFVLASNTITLALPAITSADNGLSITIKHVGSYQHLVTVVGSGGALIDNLPLIVFPRWFSVTLTAHEGNWYLKGRSSVAASTMEVSPFSSWRTLDEAIEFLGLHMMGPTVIKLSDGEYDISSTVKIDLPYPLTIQGTSFGTTTLSATSGLAGKPMFRCLSDCSFKMLQFDATSLANYGTAAGEDAIRFLGSGSYNEVKDCYFNRFYNTILDSTNAELWVFESDIVNAQRNGILLHSAIAGAVVKVAETDFTSCRRGINLEKGANATIQLASGGYYNSTATDTAIVYRPSTFTSIANISIAGNSWNNTGKFLEGFDFTRSDGRDANVILENNAGMGDANPNCTINVLNNTNTTTITWANTWYKASWTNTSSSTTKFTIGNNRITYQPTNKRNGWVLLTGNLSCLYSNRTISIGLVKNGNTSVRYGETTLRITTALHPFQFSTVVYLSDIAPGDYFEVYCTSGSSLDLVTFQDIQWHTNTK